MATVQATEEKAAEAVNATQGKENISYFILFNMI